MKKALIIALPLVVIAAVAVVLLISIFGKSEGFLVSFETGGGENLRSHRYEVIETAPYTTRSGYELDGWFFDEELTRKAEFPLEITEDTTLYAAWYKVEYTTALNSAIYLKFLSGDNENSKSYDIFIPEEMDINDVSRRGYRVQVTVSFEVGYTRDWVKDFGYLGAPKYDVSLLSAGGVGAVHENVVAPDTDTTTGISYTFSTAELEGLTFSAKTQNIQNTVHLRNVIITYRLVR